MRQRTTAKLSGGEQHHGTAEGSIRLPCQAGRDGKGGNALSRWFRKKWQEGSPDRMEDRPVLDTGRQRQ